jgi:hypothetical protein
MIKFRLLDFFDIFCWILVIRKENGENKEKENSNKETKTLKLAFFCVWVFFCFCFFLLCLRLANVDGVADVLDDAFNVRNFSHD